MVFRISLDPSLASHVTSGSIQIRGGLVEGKGYETFYDLPLME